MKTKLYAAFLFLSPIVFGKTLVHDDYDLAVVGTLCFADGIGRQSIGVIDILSPLLKVKFVSSRFCIPIFRQDLPNSVVSLLKNKRVGKARVALLEDLLTCGPYAPYKRVPNATIKLAYTMIESTELCREWVDILNNHFDAALVPDPYLVEVYKKSGVAIPVFCLPLGMYIDDLLATPAEQKKHTPFTFGFSGSFVDRKNHICLLEAFLKTFKNNPSFKLRLHGRNGDETYDLLQTMLQESGATNVEIIRSCWTWNEYVEFLKSLDCYVSVSKGEGFSLTPREAMALGLPCIISDNTAQQSMCKSGLVYALPPSHVKPAFYRHLNTTLGDFFETSVDDLSQALLNMYDHYDVWWQKAQQGRTWVSQFSYSSLTPLYHTAIKPKKVILCEGVRRSGMDTESDMITSDCLITTSPSLYKKYMSIID